MGPCCDLTYGKYLEGDNTVDMAGLQKAIDEVKEYRAGKGYQGMEHNTAEAVVAAGNLCMCDCHIKGIEVLH